MKEELMQFKLALIAVSDVERSKTFYGELFEQKVALDLGWNVMFNGGFAIQQNFAWLTGLPSDSVVTRSHNMELYFEVDDFDQFLEKLSLHPEIDLVHPPKKHDWQQRVVRLYDPDGHIIEVGESMAVIARRYLGEGKTIQETSEIIQHPVTFVEAVASGAIR
jgi:catechol 2,3-dioxygenase-like lactoylglutathione lyase family enzyme